MSPGKKIGKKRQVEQNGSFRVPAMVRTKQITCRIASLERLCPTLREPPRQITRIPLCAPKPALPYFARSNIPTTTQLSRSTMDNDKNLKEMEKFPQRQISPPPISHGSQTSSLNQKHGEADPQIFTLAMQSTMLQHTLRTSCTHTGCTHAAQCI